MVRAVKEAKKKKNKAKIGDGKNLRTEEVLKNAFI